MTLSDGIDSTDYRFLISVSILPSPMSQSLMNLGPPFFMSPLEDQTVPPYTLRDYKLPDINDPNGNSWTIKVTLGSTAPFTTFD